MKTYRQGDVLIIKIEEMPAEAKPIAPGPRGYVLAEGESTGHAHAITRDDNIAVYGLADQLFISVIGAPATVTHEEHRWIVLPEGNYKIVRQAEYTPTELRRIMD